MGQRGRLDRRAVAHSGPILALDWSMGGPAHTGDENVGSSGGGWVASGGLDRCVKIWDLSVPDSAFPNKPTYMLHPAFPVRRVLWRPEYGCELAVGSNAGFSVRSNQDLAVETVVGKEKGKVGREVRSADTGDAVEIWDVRRAWVAKWEITGSAVEGGVTGRLASILWATLIGL